MNDHDISRTIRVTRVTLYPVPGEVLRNVSALGGREAIMCGRRDRPGQQAINQKTITVETIDRQQHVIPKDSGYERSGRMILDPPTAIGTNSRRDVL